MATVYLALGSNVGIGDKQLDAAIKQLREHVSDIVEAPRYHSKAVGFVDQPDFLNTVLMVTTDLSPQELLAFTQAIEQRVGRIRRFRWGPREIDIDIIFYNYQVIDEPALTIPHPRFAEREFVLKPLNDINSEFVDPISHKSIQELYKTLPEESRSVKS